MEKEYIIRIKDNKEGKYIEEKVIGEPVELLKGYEFFIHEDLYGLDNYAISEAATGYRIASGFTKKEAIKDAIETIRRHKHEFANKISEILKDIEEIKWVKEYQTRS